MSRRRPGARAERLVDAASLWLIAAYLALMPLGTLNGLPAAAHAALGKFETAATWLFTVEYFFRVWAAEKKKGGFRYLCWPGRVWVDPMI